MTEKPETYQTTIHAFTSTTWKIGVLAREVLKNVEHTRTKSKSSTGTAAPVECIFCGEKERNISNKCQKCRNSLKNDTHRGEYHTCFHSPNVQYFESLTERWSETASLLENTEIILKPLTDGKANEMFYHS